MTTEPTIPVVPVWQLLNIHEDTYLNLRDYDRKRAKFFATAFINSISSDLSVQTIDNEDSIIVIDNENVENTIEAVLDLDNLSKFSLSHEGWSETVVIPLRQLKDDQLTISYTESYLDWYSRIHRNYECVYEVTKKNPWILERFDNNDFEITDSVVDALMTDDENKTEYFVNNDFESIDSVVDSVMADNEKSSLIGQIIDDHYLNNPYSYQRLIETLDYHNCDPDDRDNIDFLIENDTSNPFDIIRNTNYETFLRATVCDDLLNVCEDTSDASGSFLYEETMQARMRILQKVLNVDDSESHRNLNELLLELIQNGPEYWHEGVRLDTFWYDEARPFINHNHEYKPVGTYGRNIKFGPGTSLLLIDTWNGSGHEVAWPSSIELENTKKVYTDSCADGYSWQDIAGPYVPYYRHSSTIDVAMP